MLLGVACSSMLLISITEVLQDVVVEEEGVTPCNLAELVIGILRAGFDRSEKQTGI